MPTPMPMDCIIADFIFFEYFPNTKSYDLCDFMISLSELSGLPVPIDWDGNNQAKPKDTHPV